MSRQRGFTLIELAIVLVILTILIGGLAVPLTAQIQARRIAETRADMRAIQDALFGYAMRQQAGQPYLPYLPCPDNNGDGDEDRGADDECLRIECRPTERERVRKVIEAVPLRGYDGAALKLGHVVFEDEA